MFFRFLVLIHACTAFPLQCPEPAQWSTRARGLCPNPSKYSCLKNDLINGYSENCTISDFQAPGRKGVLRGGLDADICSQERYHPWPIKYYTNVSTNCIFLKSICKEEGQVVYSEGNRNTDINCRCDYSRGYDFIEKPRNPCYCVPSEEDCSCYLKTCIDQTNFLSPDYKCIREKMNTPTASCSPINKERVSTERSDSSIEDTTRAENTQTIGIILVYCIHALREKSYSKDIDGQKIQVKRLKLDRSSNPEYYNKYWMITTLEQWEKDDEYFVETRASKYVKDCLSNNKCVSVIGPPGVGKTFLVKNVALQMEQNGYTILQVGSSKDIRDNHTLKGKHLFVVDDFCGHFTANTSKLDEWKGSMNDIRGLLNTESNKLILTCRLQVFQDNCFDHLEFELFKTCICNLVDEQLALTDSEKENLASKYCKDIDRNEIRHLYRFEFFPLLCKLYDSKQSSSEFCIGTFVKDPFKFYTKELNTLYNDSLEGKYKVYALLLLVLCNNHLERKVLKGGDKNVNRLIENILESGNIATRLKGTGKSFISQFDALTGTYLSIENDAYRAIHDKMFDFLTNFFGTNITFAQLLIKYADINIINERFVILEPGQSEEAKSKEYTITVKDDYLQLYTERVFDDLTKSREYIGSSLRSNTNRNNKTFNKTLSTFCRNLKKYQISSLIQTASSVFVRDMFVMGVNDITSDTPLNKRYGIILDKDHLEKYIERVYIDMVKFHDVEFYMELCRCCRNEVFRSYFLTYMTRQSSTEIKEQIESANTKFVQLMFVLNKDDIKPITPHLYERYGIVIPVDVIQVYIERVLDDIAMSEDVNKYIQRNRNRKNKIFRTRLLDYMTKLNMATIEKLIKKGSRSFIYELCIMTIEDINEISYNECERYCVVVPDACMKLYVGRWFDEMTKSNNIYTFFEENRNRHSNKFKTALRTYMAGLEEEDIVKLIKTAAKSSNRLHDLFVTTKTDIKNDSIREFERYGIVLQDKYMDMYTEIILNSIYFIQNIKNNRTVKNVLKCMRQFDLSKIRKLMHTLNRYVIHQMITVEIENEIELDKTFSDCPCPYAVVKNSLEMKEGLITCPASLISLYMDRMISDWSKGMAYHVFSNKNLKNHSFVHRFLDHLNLLELSKKLELVNTYNCFPMGNSTPLVFLCTQGGVHLAKWCLENHLNENPEQKHNRLCALFLLVVFNNQLEETIINAEMIK